MKFLFEFDKFINPSNYDDDLLGYDFIDFHCLEDCSYVDYIYFRTINGEIDSKPICISLDLIEDIIFDDVFIIAYNHRDKVAMEVC